MGTSGETKVLVVDDAEQNRALITTWLSSRPHTSVLAVERAGAAIASIRRERIDLVLLDMVMPGIDGYAAARLLRALPEAKALPIVAITAKVGDDERARCIAAGCTEYLAKPLDKAKLLAMVERFAPLPSVPPKTDAEVLADIDAETQALVPAYLENRCAEVSVLESALTANAFETLQVIGHNLRGSGGSYGFPELTEIGATIESAAKLSDRATLEREILRLRDRLTDLVLSR